MGPLNDVQIDWQSAALHGLLAIEGVHNSPWIPAAEIREAVMEVEGCTSQAAMGALRALLTVGLADRCETSEGVFWKATDASTRAHALLMEPLADDLAAIYERLGGIDKQLDETLAVQRLRAKLEGDNQTVALIDAGLEELAEKAAPND